MLDTKGPEIRTGFFKDGVKKIQLEAGQTLELTTDYSVRLGLAVRLYCVAHVSTVLGRQLQNRLLLPVPLHQCKAWPNHLGI